MDEYIPGHVYTNIVKMAEYRGIVLSSAALDKSEVVQKLNHFEFVTISGKRGDVLTMMILIAPSSKYATKSGDFKKLLKGLPKIKESEKLDVVFVSEYALTIHIRKQILAFRTENPRIHIENHDYELFLIEIPKHSSVPKHVIPSAEEVEEFCNMHYTNPANFPKILQSDAVAVWIGLRPGMVVKVYRISETAGSAVVYRVCVKG